MFNCNECDRSYKNKKTLQHHMNQCHTNEGERTCNMCLKVFSSRITCMRHCEICPLQKNKVWEPPDKNNVNTNKTEEMRHVHVATSISINAKKILEKFKDWMREGGFSNILTAQHKRNLTENSITTYALHLRGFFSFIEESNKNNHNNNTKEKNNNNNNNNNNIDLISYAIDRRVIRDYLQYLNASAYCAKTIANKLFALERLMGFFCEKVNKLNQKKLTILTSSTKLKTALIETLEFIRTEAKIISPIATKETIVRNCRESLIQEGKWEDLSVILEKFQSNYYYHRYHHHHHHHLPSLK